MRNGMVPIVSVKVAEELEGGDAASVTLTATMANSMKVVGIPLITPVDESIESPGGSPVADQEYGGVPPVA